MTRDAAGEHFTVLWKKNHKDRASKGDYLAPDLRELLRMLLRSEDVSPATTVSLIIHHHQKDGSVKEVMYADSSSNVISVDHTTAGHTVEKIKLNKKERRLLAKRREELARQARRPVVDREKQMIEEAREILTKYNQVATKPHIRLTHDPQEIVVVGACGLYTARKVKK